MENKTIPYIAYELEQAKHERTVKRLIVLLVITIMLMFFTNLAWIYAWNIQHEQGNVEMTTESGTTNYIGGNGTVSNG